MAERKRVRSLEVRIEEMKERLDRLELQRQIQILRERNRVRKRRKRI